MFTGDGGRILEGEGFVRRVDREHFERRVPAVMGREVEEARAAAGMTEVQLEGDAFVVLLFGERLEPGVAEKKPGVVQRVDKQFGEGVTLGEGAGLELVEIIFCAGAFFQDRDIARPVSSLKADLADGGRIDLVELPELLKGLAGWLFHEHRFARGEQLGEDGEVGFRCCTDEDTGDGIIGGDRVEVVGKAAAGEEGGKLLLPVGALGTDIFQPDVVVPEDWIERSHAVDAEAHESIVLLRVKEGVLKILFLAVMIKFL